MNLSPKSSIRLPQRFLNTAFRFRVALQFNPFEYEMGANSIPGSGIESQADWKLATQFTRIAKYQSQRLNSTAKMRTLSVLHSTSIEFQDLP